MSEVPQAGKNNITGCTYPSVREVERKSIMARARRFFESRGVDAWKH